MDKLGVGDLVVSNLGYLRIDTINHTATSTVSVRATGLSDGRSYVMLDVRRTARVSVIPRAHAHQINPIGHIVH